MAADVSERGAGTDGGGGNSHDRARVVRRYLSALDSKKPGRSLSRTAETVAHRMHQIDTLLLSADPVQRLHLTQERIDLHAEHLRLRTSGAADFADLERSFARVARSYGDRHGITYSAWRQIGVDADVLARAGIKPHVKPGRPTAPAAAEPKKYKAAATATADAPKPEAAKEEAPKDDAPKDDAPKAADPKPAEPKKEPAKAKTPAKKKAAPAKKAAASSNGNKAPAKKAAKATAKVENPQQQRLPAEAHLLS